MRAWDLTVHCYAALLALSLRLKFKTFVKHFAQLFHFHPNESGGSISRAFSKQRKEYMHL